MGLTDIIISVFGGGATGLLGAMVSRYGDYKNRQLDIELQKLKFQNELALREADARIMEQEWNARVKVAEVEGESRVEVADSEAFKASLTMEPQLFHNQSKITNFQNGLMVVLDFIRGIIRPGLTVYLCAITTAVYLQAGTIIKQVPLPVMESVNIYTQISSTILYLTTTCVLFYFGVRMKDQPPRNKK